MRDIKVECVTIGGLLGYLRLFVHNFANISEGMIYFGVGTQ